MTALNIASYENAAIILTDTASYKPNGVIHAFQRKCETIPKLNIVAATSGYSKLRDIMRRNLTRDFQYENALHYLWLYGENYFSEWYDVYKGFLAEQGSPDVMIAIAGWSKMEERVRVLLFSTEDGESTFGEPTRVQMPLMGGGEPDRPFELSSPEGRVGAVGNAASLSRHG